MAFRNWRKLGFKFLVLDESHNVKNEKAVQTQSIQLVAKKCARIVLFSGTSSTIRPMAVCTHKSHSSSPPLFSTGCFWCSVLLMAKKALDSIGIIRAHLIWKNWRLLLQSTIMIRRLKQDVFDSIGTTAARSYFARSDREMERQRNICRPLKAIGTYKKGRL